MQEEQVCILACSWPGTTCRREILVALGLNPDSPDFLFNVHSVNIFNHPLPQLWLLKITLGVAKYPGLG